ncbi:MAG: hypothetical protein HY785_00245 [Oscillatoriophycideae cyanobacterium NC_groundwater_1537_Pr4_S-0.65um_50_18]|nr:hypothetical protein [Oscillatoriophycideae cyanobacterium NC_groundwater_1537_Pr4_S-0.65um_50_18]
MTHLTNKPNVAQPPARRMRASEPSWLWLALGGGSIALHLLAVVILLPIASRASMQNKPLEISPIDFVALPGTNPSTSSSTKKSTSPKAIAAPPPAVPAPVSQSDSGEIGFAPPPEPSPEPPIAPSVEPSVEPSVATSIAPSPVPESPVPESPSPVPSASASPVPESPVPASPAPEFPSPVPESSTPDPGASAVPSQPLASATPPQQAGQAVPSGAGLPSPLVVTEPISAAIPDTSGQYSAESQPTPLTLTASLQVAAVPPEQLEMPPPDAIAQPTVSAYTFAPNPQDTICIPEAEVAQFNAPGGLTLGAEVGVQVATNEVGQVIDTAVWQPSQNSLNDQLATCLVKNWNWAFQPAIAQGQPVASKALVIWVKIDRS